MAPERRLAAILSADVVGYSRLMAEDEQGTIQTLTAHRGLISSLVGRARLPPQSFCHSSYWARSLCGDTSLTKKSLDSRLWGDESGHCAKHAAYIQRTFIPSTENTSWN